MLFLGLGLHALKHLIKYNFVDILNTTQWFHVLAGKRRRGTKKTFYFLTPVKTRGCQEGTISYRNSICASGLVDSGFIQIFKHLIENLFWPHWLSGNIFLINWLSNFHINPLDLIVHSFRLSQSGSVYSNLSDDMRLLTVLLFWFRVECEGPCKYSSCL